MHQACESIEARKKNPKKWLH